MNAVIDRTGESVVTWADGFGTWHARVSFPSPGYGPAFIAAHIDRVRAKARRAIRRELVARYQLSPAYRLSIKVEANALDHLNRTHSITFVEA